MINILLFILFWVFVYVAACYVLYQQRSKSLVFINFDSVMVDIEPIVKRAKIYVKNNPSKSMGDYIGAHILDQEVKPEGIKQVLELQKQMYNLVFVSCRHESVRAETAKVLNDWGIKGQLYLNTSEQSPMDHLQSLEYVKQVKAGQGFRTDKIIGFEQREVTAK